MICNHSLVQLTYRATAATGRVGKWVSECSCRRGRRGAFTCRTSWATRIPNTSATTRPSRAKLPTAYAHSQLVIVPYHTAGCLGRACYRQGGSKETYLERKCPLQLKRLGFLYVIVQRKSMKAGLHSQHSISAYLLVQLPSSKLVKLLAVNCCGVERGGRRSTTNGAYGLAAHILGTSAITKAAVDRARTTAEPRTGSHLVRSICRRLIA